MRKLILLPLISILLLSCAKPSGTITGVVMFNERNISSTSADLGAKIYVTTENCDTISAALKALFDRDYAHQLNEIIKLYQGSSEFLSDTDDVVSDNMKRLNEVQSELSKFASDSLEFDTKIEHAYNKLFDIKESKSIASTTVDGTGKYTITLPPGEYNVIAMSKSLSDLNLIEHSGKVLIKKVKVESKVNSNLDFEFSAF